MESGFASILPEWMQQYDPQLLQGAAAFSIILILFLIALLIRRKRNKKTLSTLTIQSFQIAPLGRDAFLQINNPSASLTLLNLELLDQAAVEVKNQVGGHILATGTSYSILLEARGNERICPDFNIAITFVDEHRKTYQQVFSLDPIESISLRRKRM